MGLFKKKRTIVTFGTSNLQGPLDKRKRWLIGTFIQGVLEEQPELGMYIVHRLMAGPFSKLKRLYKGAHTYGHFTLLNNPGIRIKNIDTTIINNAAKNYVDSLYSSEYTVEVLSSYYGVIELTLYALKYLRENGPESAFEFDFYPDYDESTSVIHYDFSDVNDTVLHPPVSIPVPPLDFVSEYLFIVYHLYKAGKEETIDLTPNPPSGTGEYTPPPEITNTTVSVSSDATQVHVKTSGTSENIFFEPGDVVLGTPQTTKGMYTYKISYSVTYENTAAVGDPPVQGNALNYTVTYLHVDIKKSFEITPYQTLIYKQNSGIPALDTAINLAITQSPTIFELFYPPIPLRLDHQLMSSLSPPWWAICKKIAKRNDIKLDKVLKALQKEDSWKDMSYVFLTFGVGLNGHNKNRKDLAKYLWHFFSMFSLNTNTDVSSKISTYTTQLSIYYAALEAYNNNPAMWTGSLPTPPAPLSLGSQIRFEFFARDYNFGFRNEYTFTNISYLSGTGLYKGSLKPGFYAVDPAGSFYAGTPILQPPPGSTLTPPSGQYNIPEGSFRVVHQINATQWEALQIEGAELKVRILKEYSRVTVLPAEEGQPQSNMGTWTSVPGDSDFHIPLLPSILKKCGIVASSQIATECIWVHVNIYKKVKVKRGWVAWIGFIIAIVVSIYCQACGAQLFTLAAGAGAAMTILVAVANVIVASLIMWALKIIVVKLFGDKWGTLIAIVASIVLQNWSSNGFQGISFANFATAPNLLSLGTQVVGGYGEYYQAKNVELQKQMEEYSKDMKQKWDEINSQLYSNTGTIDPVTLLNIMRTALDTETPQQFLTRTLWSGSDIADMSLASVYEFSQSALALNASI